MNKFFKSCASVLNSASRSVAAVAIGATVALSGAVVQVHAEDVAVTLPSTGVDVGAYATAAISSLGAVVAVCIGGTVAFLLIRKGLRWVRGM